MFTVNLEEKLVDAKRESLKHSQEDLILAEANRILEQADNEKLEALYNAGLGNNLSKQKKILATREELSKYDAGRVFSKDEIKEVCIAYGLRFLPSHMFTGTVDPALAGKLVEFEHKHGKPDKINMSYGINAFGFHSVSGNYFIAAPRS